MKYEIYMNVETDPEGRLMGMWDGFKPSHKMQKAYTGEIDEYQFTGTSTLCTDVCEELFRIFNIEHPADYRARSLSVGDVIVLQHQYLKHLRLAFAVSRVGFEDIALSENITQAEDWVRPEPRQARSAYPLA